MTKILATHLLRFPPLLGPDDPTLDGLVFYGEKGGPVRRHVFRRIWIKACEEAGVEPIRREWLRHSGASLGYAASRDMKAVAARLGHTSVRMLDTVYVEIYSDAARGLADAIDRLVEDASTAGPRRDD